MTEDDRGLDDLWARYRAACPEVEVDANFMPRLWDRIASRHSFWFEFQDLARAAMTAATALCLLFLLLNFISVSENHLAPSYADALAADHSAENTYYTEAIRSTPENIPAPVPLH
jgi:hypothetical protein